MTCTKRKRGAMHVCVRERDPEMNPREIEWVCNTERACVKEKNMTTLYVGCVRHIMHKKTLGT